MFIGVLPEVKSTFGWLIGEGKDSHKLMDAYSGGFSEVKECPW